jgi:protein phosphatase methylesterase 1
MLLLAGTDRLDKALSIGQMQGKFQLSLMPSAGHAIQEDEAVKTAELMLQFLQRFRIGLPPLQFPKAPAGTKPVLPLVAGPALSPQQP